MSTANYWPPKFSVFIVTVTSSFYLSSHACTPSHAIAFARVCHHHLCPRRATSALGRAVLPPVTPAASIAAQRRLRPAPPVHSSTGSHASTPHWSYP